MQEHACISGRPRPLLPLAGLLGVSFEVGEPLLRCLFLRLHLLEPIVGLLQVLRGLFDLGDSLVEGLPSPRHLPLRLGRRVRLPAEPGSTRQAGLLVGSLRGQGLVTFGAELHEAFGCELSSSACQGREGLEVLDGSLKLGGAALGASWGSCASTPLTVTTGSCARTTGAPGCGGVPGGPAGLAPLPSPARDGDPAISVCGRLGLAATSRPRRRFGLAAQALATPTPIPLAAGCRRADPVAPAAAATAARVSAARSSTRARHRPRARPLRSWPQSTT